MGKVISVAGKGGVGKTTIAGVIILELCKRGKPVLAVDADPNHNLGDRLGAPVTTTIGALREQLMKAKDELPAGVSKQEIVDYQLRMALQEEECYDLLTMGRQEGPGCYCYINSILRTFTDALAEKYAYVVIDNEAGLEHLSRRTTIGSDVLFVVSDSTGVALKAAGRIGRLSDEMDLKVKRKVLIVNKLNEKPEKKILATPEYSFDSTYNIRIDQLLESSAAEGKPLSSLRSDSGMIADIRIIVESEISR